eukprot:CAMPEP_0178452294 /NCGR_PEP_ID=MMETSP0689_2-20121128/44167_1 /TAXON_ID=160604 /ORGANISM="Amphidinium massartii, Strain CS-259" /LENGTH=67 /DNA_ID=CAMNT_0020077989 /DNA_START=152 /DNA_END=352 /DNA_ORIENTATION=+
MSRTKSPLPPCRLCRPPTAETLNPSCVAILTLDDTSSTLAGFTKMQAWLGSGSLSAFSELAPSEGHN